MNSKEEIDNIKKLQRILNALYYGKGQIQIDGILGRKTRKALKQYQKNIGLNPTGKLNKMTKKSFELKWY
jgi:peptidoglycan hydrolase-like protein with peptidoglycan-binding domain